MYCALNLKALKPKVAPTAPFTLKLLSSSATTDRIEQELLRIKLENIRLPLIKEYEIYMQRKLKEAKSNYQKFRIYKGKRDNLFEILSKKQKHNLYFKINKYEQLWKNDIARQKETG